MDKKLVEELEKLLLEVTQLFKSRIEVLENNAIAKTRFFTARLYSVYLKHIERLNQKLAAHIKDVSDYPALSSKAYADITKRLERLLLVLELDMRNSEVAAEVITVTAHKEQLKASRRLKYLLEVLLEHKELKQHRGNNKKHWGSEQDLMFIDYTLLRLLQHPKATEEHLKILINSVDSGYNNLEPTKKSSKINCKINYPYKNTFQHTFSNLKQEGLSVQEKAIEGIKSTYLLNQEQGDGILLPKKKRDLDVKFKP